MKLGWLRRIETERISNDDVSLSGQGEIPCSDGSPGRDFPIWALTNETQNFNSRSNGLAGRGETPRSEGSSGRDDPGRPLTNETLGFYPYVESLSDSVIGHPLIDESLSSIKTIRTVTQIF